MKKLHALIAALGATSGALALPAHATLFWGAEMTGIETEMSTEPCGSSTSGCGCGNGASLQITNSNARSGSTSGLALLSKCHERAEWREKTAVQAPLGADRYYAFSLRPASNFDMGRWTIVHQMAQWYSGVPAWADTGAWWILTIDQGRWSYRIKYSDGSPQNVKTVTYDLGPVARGAWTDFIVNGVFKPNSGGKFQVWVRQPGTSNYVKKGYREGSVILDVPKAPYFKVGLYRGDPNWAGVNAQDSIQVDAVKVASSFNEVLPSGNPAAAASSSLAQFKPPKTTPHASSAPCNSCGTQAQPSAPPRVVAAPASPWDKLLSWLGNLRFFA